MGFFVLAHRAAMLVRVRAYPLEPAAAIHLERPGEVAVRAVVLDPAAVGGDFARGVLAAPRANGDVVTRLIGLEQATVVIRASVAIEPVAIGSR